tara:strand:+ start:3904 stop:4884 length:981 start_codon:yes stop_codon:yes gene_type:complete
LKIIKNIFIILNILLFSCADNIAPLNNTSSLNIKGDISTLNIVTWNIENFPKNDLTPDYVQTIVDSMNVDIIALQEIRNLTSLNNIAYNLGDNWVAYRSPGSSSYGNLAFLINTNEVNIVNNPYTMPNEDFSCPAYTVNIENHRCSYEDPIDFEYNFAYRMPYILDFEYNNQLFSLVNIHLKCCNNNGDEKPRRFDSISHLHNYILSNFTPRRNILIVGDYNDNLQTQVNYTGSDTGIFYLLESNGYAFADQDISTGSSANFSYPSYPSHIDHIVINSNILNNPNITYETHTLLVENVFSGGFSEYDSYVSDHRPVLINLDIPISD